MTRLGLTLCLGTLALAGSVFAADERVDSKDDRRPPAVVVWTYGPSHSGFSRISYDDCGPSGLSRSVGDAVSSRLDYVNRFDLASPASLNSTGTRAFGRAPRTPQEAVEAGRELGVDYLLYGNVESASTDLDRCETETGKGKKRHREVTYTGKTELIVHHVAVDVRSGQVWREWRDKDCRSFTSDCYPDRSQFRSSFLKSVDSTAASWVRQLVPYRRGQIISKGDGVVVIDLGRRDGVGMDTDFSFVREDILRDKAGAPLLDKEGQPLTHEVPIVASPSGDHKPGPIYGRPVTLEDDYCVVKVGYKGSGGFLGLETKLKENANCLNALRVGDDAVLWEHVGK